jgi:hypothetical protein
MATPQQVMRAIIRAYQKNVALYIEGSPGIGKTAICNQARDILQTMYSEDTDIPLIDSFGLIDMPTLYMDPTDFKGVPDMKSDSQFATWKLEDVWPHQGRGLILLDEFPSAPPAVQAGCYRLLFGGTLGYKYRLPPGWGIVGAGNKMTDKAYVNRINTANRSRLWNITLDVSYEQWHEWALKAGIRPEVIFYHRLRSYEWFYRFDPSRDDTTFPCPRTWELLSRVYDDDLRKEDRFIFLSGIVGEGAAADFCGFVDILDDITNPDVIVAKPMDVPIPENPAVLYATAAAVANRATKANMANVCAFADRLPDEFSTLLIYTIVKKNGNLQATPAFQKWAIAHPGTLS